MTSLLSSSVDNFMSYIMLTHIVSIFHGDNQKFVYVILSFPPLGYQLGLKTGYHVFWKVRGFHARMQSKHATKNVTSDKMTLREFHGANLLFRNRN